MANPHQFDDAAMHRLFRALREHVVEVFGDFADRVLARIEALIEAQASQGPSWTALVGDTTVESTNMIVRVVLDHLEAPGGESESAGTPSPSDRDSDREEDDDE